MNRIRMLIAEDHPVFRYGLRALLSAEPTTEEVGEATTGEEVIERALSLQPDVVLKDIVCIEGAPKHESGPSY